MKHNRTNNNMSTENESTHIPIATKIRQKYHRLRMPRPHDKCAPKLKLAASLARSDTSRLNFLSESIHRNNYL
eukprot:scaffold166312_cov39-Prasinocladus_malaysianus.AAC.1